MADIDLLIFGCVVLLVAIAGIYVAARENIGYSRLKGPRRRRCRDEKPVGPTPAQSRCNI